MNPLRSFRALGVAVLAGALVAGTAIPAMAGGGTTRLRAFHDSPDTPKVDILVNGQPSGFEDVPYKAITPYVDLPVGAEVTVRIVEGPATGAELKISVPASDRPLTVAAIGSLQYLLDSDASNDGRALQLKAFADRQGGLWNTALLRVVHTSPDAPAVDIQVHLGGRWVTVIDGLRFGKASPYLPLPQRFLGKPIRYTFRVLIDGTRDEVTRVTTPLPNKAQSVWAIGFAGKGVNTTSDSFSLFITKDGRN
jgi:hypothetical protein